MSRQWDKIVFGVAMGFCVETAARSAQIQVPAARAGPFISAVMLLVALTTPQLSSSSRGDTVEWTAPFLTRFVSERRLGPRPLRHQFTYTFPGDSTCLFHCMNMVRRGGVAWSDVCLCFRTRSTAGCIVARADEMSH